MKIELNKNQHKILLCQDKGTGTVVIKIDLEIIYRNKYANKCLDILDTEQFRKSDRDATKYIEAKIKELLEKSKVTSQNKSM